MALTWQLDPSAVLFNETQFRSVFAPFRETLARLTVTFDGRIVIAPASADY